MKVLNHPASRVNMCARVVCRTTQVRLCLSICRFKHGSYILIPSTYTSPLTTRLVCLPSSPTVPSDVQFLKFCLLQALHHCILKNALQPAAKLGTAISACLHTCTSRRTTVRTIQRRVPSRPNVTVRVAAQTYGRTSSSWER